MEHNAKQSRIRIPDYTLGEEIFNAVSHGLGAALSTAALALMLARARGALATVTAAVFGASMILLYTVSCLYHALGRNVKGKKVLRVIDHCTVYALVLGTYAPAALLGVGGAKGWVLLGIVFCFAAAGIALTAVRVDRFKALSVACHLACGWSILAGIPQLLATMGPRGVTELVLGGALYSLGAALYGLGAKRRYMHSLFHLFCLGGSFFHFIAIYRCLL